MERRIGFIRVAAIISVTLLFVVGPLIGPALAKTVEMSMGCGPAAASGYPAGVALSSYLNKKIEGLKLIPIELGTTAAIRRVSAGEMDLTYSNSFDLVSAYENTGAFKKQALKPGTQPYQGIWFWPAVMFMVTRTDTDIYSVDQLKGRNVTLGDPKWGLYAPTSAGFRALGFTGQWREKITTGADMPQALKSKLVDASMACVIGNNTLARFTMQVELYNKLRALKMTRAQGDIIERTPGISFMSVPAKLFKHDMGMEQIPGIGILYGWSFAPSADVNLVYQFVKNCFENSAKLEELARPFQMFNGNPKETVIFGLKACSKIPVHPGAAKYYKEIGIWDASWIEGKAGK